MNDNIYYVYIHFNKETKEPFYVGRGQRYRMNQTYKRSEEWKEIVSNFGYYIELVAENLTSVEADVIERKYIKDLRDNGSLLVNKTSGGQAGYVYEFSEEHKEKLSKSLKGKNTWTKGRKLSESHKKALLDSLIGNTNNKGKKFTEDHKEKISKSNMGKVFSEDHIKNLSESHKGHVHTEEQKRKISESGKEAWKLRREKKQELLKLNV